MLGWSSVDGSYSVNSWRKSIKIFSCLDQPSSWIPPNHFLPSGSDDMRNEEYTIRMGEVCHMLNIVFTISVYNCVRENSTLLLLAISLTQWLCFWALKMWKCDTKFQMEIIWKCKSQISQPQYFHRVKTLNQLQSYMQFFLLNTVFLI